MTVIAYVNKKLYSDKLHILDESDIFIKKHIESKTHVNEDKTIAFCYTGESVPSSSVPLIFTALFQFLNAMNIVKNISTSNEYFMDERMQNLLEVFSRKYIVMTKTVTFAIDINNITYLDAHDVYTHGKDGNYFKDLYLTGMKPEKIIPYIFNNLSSGITEEFDCVSQTNLKNIKFLFDAKNKISGLDYAKQISKDASNTVLRAKT